MTTHRFEGQPVGINALDWQAQRLFQAIELRRKLLAEVFTTPVPVGSRKPSRRQQVRSMLHATPEERAAILGSADSGFMTELEEWLGPMTGSLLQHISPQGALPPGGAEELGGIL